MVVSPQFFAWVTGFGAKAKIVAPPEVVDRMRGHINTVAAMY
ncbi:MAG: hypothetical protein IK136_03270 [Oscillospiraceae bacterium]|nr:hypothetical protein [Oscillospiraceae bacterium]